MDHESSCVAPGACRAGGLVTVSLLIAAGAAFAQTPPPPSSQKPAAVALPPHMSEDARAEIAKVVVISGRGPANQEVSGSYEKETAGLVGGLQAGSRMGTISREIGGVPVNIPIPGLALPGAILGGLTGLTRRELQEFRDRLTEEIANADSPPLRSDGLAIDTFWGIRRLPHVESHLFSPNVEISADTDAVLYVTFEDLKIEVQGSDAVISTSAIATLRRHSDGHRLYESIVHYEDRDKLRNWTADDNAVWRTYTNYARFYLGREVAADVFGRVDLEHTFEIKATESAKRVKKHPHTVASESLTPTLAWELALDDSAANSGWSGAIDRAQIFYDVEVFDNRQLVYDAQQVPQPSHTLAYELEPCQTYRWSVRPAYHVDGQVRFGEWMRFSPPVSDKKKKKKDDDESGAAALTKKGLVGRQASAAPAYIQDFAYLDIACRR